MSKTILHDLATVGQSVWLDNINRSMITQGALSSLIALGLRGQTSNPTIFKQAISSSADYDVAIRRLLEEGKSTFEIYDALTIQDVQDAADLFFPVYEKTQGLDGYVSLEINPKLANELQAQLQEGMRLWQKLNRPNVMIKVPATKNGVAVVEGLIAQGINVNVTLIFSPEQYQQVFWAYTRGLEYRIHHGGDIRKVHAVASVFVSRLDARVDKCLEKESPLRGKTAVDNAVIIYHKFQQNFRAPVFKALEDRGANVQRVLWASTATKDPCYSDIKYVTELIAAGTVNTIPDKTLEAVLDHGVVASQMPVNVAQAQKTIDALRAQGVDVGIICQELLDDGLTAFEKSFEDLMTGIQEKTTVMRQLEKN